jgi:hypothetical protein
MEAGELQDEGLNCYAFLFCLFYPQLFFEALRETRKVFGQGTPGLHRVIDFIAEERKQELEPVHV